jgi:hypothetical protein
MRRIERTSQFKRDYKREKKGQHRSPGSMIYQAIPALGTDYLYIFHPYIYGAGGDKESFGDAGRAIDDTLCCNPLCSVWQEAPKAALGSCDW